MAAAAGTGIGGGAWPACAPPLAVGRVDAVAVRPIARAQARAVVRRRRREVSRCAGASSPLTAKAF